MTLGGFFGDDDDDDEDPIEGLEDDIANVRQRLTEVSQLISGEHIPADERGEIASEQTELFDIAYRHLKDGVDLIYTPPAENPTTDELAANLTYIADVYHIDNLKRSTGKADIEALQDEIDAFQGRIELADTFDYAFEEHEIKKQYSRKVQSIGVRTDLNPDELRPGEDPTEIFAGPRARKQLADIPADPDNKRPPLFIGTGTRSGRDATIERDTLFRHRSIFGVTGYGKSTLLTNDFRQLAEAGAGGCFIDPKGDDSERLMEILPEHRLDDVIWLEPGSARDYVSGFNFISVGINEDHPHYDTALSALVHDLVKLLGAGKYWGPRMDRITQNLIRAMDTFNRERPEYPDLNLADLYYILGEAESRIEFASRVNYENIDFIEDYTAKIGEMEEDVIEPVLGRLQPWIENPTVRRMIAFRESEVNIQRAVEDGKILIVRMGAQPPDVKRMVGMAIIRRIWSVIRARAEQEERNRDPYFLFADEFDNFAKTPDEAIPTMLSESRSYRLSLNLCCQYPDQIASEILDGMMTNSDTLMTFNVGAPKQARHIAPQLDVDNQTLLNEVPFHIWMKRKLPGSMEESDAFQVYTHPPFPPLREKHERNQLIKESIREHGRERRTDQEIKDDLLFFGGDGRLETGVGQYVLQQPEPELVNMAYEQAIEQGPYAQTGLSPYEQQLEEDDALPEEIAADLGGGGGTTAGGSPSGEASGGGGPNPAPGSGSGSGASPPPATNDSAITNDAGEVIAKHGKEILSGIWAARLQAGKDPGELVPKDDVIEQIQVRIGDTGYESDIANTLEKLKSETGYIVDEMTGGRPHFGLTKDAMNIVKAQDSGSGGSAGKMKHRIILEKWMVVGTALGYDTWIPSQDDDARIDVDVDGVSETPFDPSDIDTTGLSADEVIEKIETRRDELADRYPAVEKFSDGKDVYVEAETSTPDKPYQPLINLRKAVDNDATCVFAVKDDSQHPDYNRDIDYWARRIENVLYDVDRQDGQGEPRREEGFIFAKTLTDDGGRVFYNQRTDYRVAEGIKGLRNTANSRSSVSWFEADSRTLDGVNSDRGEVVVATDSEHDGPFAVFNSVDAIRKGGDAAREALPAYYSYNKQTGEYVVATTDHGEERVLATYESEDALFEEWSCIKEPYIPEHDYETPLDEVDEDNYYIVIFPDAEHPTHDQPLIYHKGNLYPLYDALDIPVPTTWDDLSRQEREDAIAQQEDQAQQDQEQEPEPGQEQGSAHAQDSDNGAAPNHDTTPDADSERGEASTQASATTSESQAETGATAGAESDADPSAGDKSSTDPSEDSSPATAAENTATASAESAADDGTDAGTEADTDDEEYEHLGSMSINEQLKEIGDDEVAKQMGIYEGDDDDDGDGDDDEEGDVVEKRDEDTADADSDGSEYAADYMGSPKSDDRAETPDDTDDTEDGTEDEEIEDLGSMSRKEQLKTIGDDKVAKQMGICEGHDDDGENDEADDSTTQSANTSPETSPEPGETTGYPAANPEGERATEAGAVAKANPDQDSPAESTTTDTPQPDGPTENGATPTETSAKHQDHTDTSHQSTPDADAEKKYLESDEGQDQSADSASPASESSGFSLDLQLDNSKADSASTDEEQTQESPGDETAPEDQSESPGVENDTTEQEPDHQPPPEARASTDNELYHSRHLSKGMKFKESVLYGRSAAKQFLIACPSDLADQIAGVPVEDSDESEV